MLYFASGSCVLVGHGGGVLSSAEEREGRRPGGSFVKLAGSSDEGIYGNGLSPVWATRNMCYDLILWTDAAQRLLCGHSAGCLGCDRGPVVSKQPDLGKGMFKASSWILPRFACRVMIVVVGGEMRDSWHWKVIIA